MEAWYSSGMMIAFGRFVELSIPTSDVLQSLGFYRSLGFAEGPVGDVRRWHYAVVSDGAITIGLHAAGFEEPTLSFVRPEVARQVRTLETLGQSIEWQRVLDDDFHEAAVRSPDGQLIRMMEARTFSPAEVPDVSMLGAPCGEVTVPCAEPRRTQGWYEAAGFVAGEDAGIVYLSAPGVRLGIRAGSRQTGAQLRFRPNAPDAIAAELRRRDFEPVRSPSGHEIRAPEGTRLLVEAG